MSIINEFKAFALKGNVIDLAVGVIIGGAFGKITTSAVEDVFMPPLGLLTSGIKFENIKLMLKPATTDAAGKVITEAVTINIGNFIQVSVQFMLMAIAVFIMIKFINKLKQTEEAKPAPPAPSQETVLLAEIRDHLAKMAPVEGQSDSN